MSLLALASFSLTSVTLDLCILVASALGRDPGTYLASICWPESIAWSSLQKSGVNLQF